MKIIPSITTGQGSNWREKIKEINFLRLEEIALFPTFLEREERNVLYQLLKESRVKRIPLVHLREDMDVEELIFLVKEYDTQVFNTHSEREYKINKDWILGYKDKIFIENTHKFPLDEEEIKKYGGICLDFSHLENTRILEPERYEKEKNLLSKFKIGCNHIAAVKKEAYVTNNKKESSRHDSHRLENLSELDYLKNYPIEYFSDYCAIELINKISDQVDCIKYINYFMEKRDSLINKIVG